MELWNCRFIIVEYGTGQYLWKYEIQKFEKGPTCSFWPLASRGPRLIRRLNTQEHPLFQCRIIMIDLIWSTHIWGQGTWPVFKLKLSELTFGPLQISDYVEWGFQRHHREFLINPIQNHMSVSAAEFVEIGLLIGHFFEPWNYEFTKLKRVTWTNIKKSIQLSDTFCLIIAKDGNCIEIL